MTVKSIDSITDYHAHVYYDAESKDKAAVLRAAIEERFDIRMGRWHDRPVGPHPRWSYQVAFDPAQFSALIPFLALNRNDLTVLVHPNSGASVPDHTDHAMWMGDMPALNLDVLRKIDEEKS